jgi:hypothetical protein
MSKYKQVRAAIDQLEQGVFQLLANNYLSATIRGELHTPGSVEGNDKTRTGKPDAYIYTEQGFYVLGEHTTKDGSDRSKFFKKLKKDLNDCLNFSSLGIPEEKIEYIVQCCNSSVEPKDRETLRQMAAAHGIAHKMVTLEDLAGYYSTIGKVFAKDFLGIAYDTGQILDKKQFLERYHVRNISTRLDNALVGREFELKDLTGIIAEHQIALVTGKPGTGKSRLCMAAIDGFLETNPDYNAYYIFGKEGPITEDLLTYLDLGKSYILLIDDANRQLENLITIIQELIEEKFKIKILITVRDYAKEDILQHIRKLDFQVFHVFRMSNETIVGIVSGDPFQISSPPVLSRIAEVSKGNPRMALMAAAVVKDNQDLNLLKDAVTIYDEYFQSVFDDGSIFKQADTLKVLGLIAFFNSFDPKEPHDQKALEWFDIPQQTFETIAKELESLEVLDSYSGIYKITEQVISEYFFFLSFIREKVLSLELLLTTYFQTHYWRVKESLNSAIITFGEENVLAPTRGLLLSYWSQIKTDQLAAIRFMDAFGVYLPDQVCVYIYEHIKNLGTQPQSDSQSIRKYQGNAEGRDNVVNLIRVLLDADRPDFLAAIELLLYYVHQQPDKVDVVTDMLKTPVYPAENYDGKRIAVLRYAYQIMERESRQSYDLRYVFYYTMKHALLSGDYPGSLYQQKDNGVYYLSEELLELRASFLKELHDSYQHYPTLVFDILMQYLDEHRQIEQHLLYLDRQAVFQLLEERMDPVKFADSYLVIKFLDLLEDRGMELKEQAELRARFNTEKYRIFELLSHRTAKIRELRAKQLSYDEIEEINRKEIKEGLPVANLQDFIDVFQVVLEIRQSEYRQNFDLAWGMGIWMTYIFSNVDLGFEVLSYYMSFDDTVYLNSVPMFHVVYASGAANTERLYQIISKPEYRNKEFWLDRFFYYTPLAFITDETIQRVYRFYATSKLTSEIYPSHYQNYESYRPGFLEGLMLILTGRYSKPDFKYKVCHKFFESAPQLLKNNLDLCKTIYQQQEESRSDFDHDGKELLLLVEMDPTFFSQTVDSWYQRRQDSDNFSRKMLAGVWKRADASQLVYDSVLRIKDYDGVFASEHFCLMFFNGMQAEHHTLAKEVLEQLVKENPDNTKILNTVLDICRNRLAHLQNGMISLILTVNSELEKFKELSFYNNHFSTTSGEIWSEVIARQLTEVLKVIFEMPSQFRYFGHRDYLSSRIQIYKDDAAYQRRLKYRGAHYH